MKKYFAALLSVILLFGSAASVQAAATKYKVYVDGALATSNGIVRNGTTLVPFKPVLSAMGFGFQYDGKSKTVKAKKSGTVITLTIGNKKASVNGTAAMLPVAPTLINNTTYIPVRFVGESTGYSVSADKAAGSIYVDSQSDEDYVSAEPGQTTTPPASTAAAGTLNTQQITKLNDSKVVMIEMEKGQGSGVYLGEGVFITNHHVIEGSVSGRVVDTNGRYFDIEGVIAHDTTRDLALIKITSNTFQATTVTIGNPSDLSKGEKVVAIGSPMGMQNTVAEGLVSSFRTTEDNVKLIQISVPIDHGSSGGALFNQKGQLVGITASGIDSNASLNFAIDIREAAGMLELTKGMRYAQLTTTPLSSLAAAVPASSTGSSETPDNVARSMVSTLNSSATLFPTPSGSIQLGKWISYVEDGTVVVFNVLDADDYAAYNRYFDSNHAAYEQWMDNLGRSAAKSFPNNKIMICLFYEDMFTSYPSSFDEEEIETVPGGYEVFHLFAVSLVQNGKVESAVRP
ncbi:stalk domain-containing protein [Paenibacillus tarimensis]|uniref:stalk domain-containing protein n=1 Tax=Paenibacillus tarimensis TaxID=416012 RepID=UPI001F229638|nr:trypsin-like peptidase domain-containing protein [Paenibacillus tarimensis]MCF2945861.1 trypsin-like peptidase domain-containing protein [Paenibacillus tarimensis]